MYEKINKGMSLEVDNLKLLLKSKEGNENIMHMYGHS